MIDEVLYLVIAMSCVTAFMIGSGLVLVLMLKHTLQSHLVTSQFMLSELEKSKSLLETKCGEFDEITKKASAANLSLSSRIPEIDNKILDVENKINMIHLRFNGR